MRYLQALLLSVLAMVLSTHQVLASERVWLDIKGGSSFEKEFILHRFNKMSDKILFTDLDRAPSYTGGRRFNGGITVNIGRGYNSCFSTRGGAAYNINLEKYRFSSIKINLDCVDYYSEINRLYAWQNALNHEYFCHGVTQLTTHNKWGLCRPVLSSDKVYWGKKHRKWLRKKLNPPGLTGEFLNFSTRSLVVEEDELYCEIPLPKELKK